MQPQSLNEEKLVPIDTSGDNVEVELKEEKKEEKVNDTNVEVQEEKPQEEKSEGQEHEQYLNKKKKKDNDPRLRINELTGKFREEERQKNAALEFAKAVQKENEELKKKNSTLDNSYIEEFKQRATTEENNIKKELKRQCRAVILQNNPNYKQN